MVIFIYEICNQMNMYVTEFCMTASVVWCSEYLATDPEARVRFPALPEKNSGSRTESTQPREYN
jgi:hypothetical protein